MYVLAIDPGSLWTCQKAALATSSDCPVRFLWMRVLEEREHLMWFTIAEEISVDRTGSNTVDIDSPGS